MIQWKLDCQKQKDKSQPATTNQPQSLRSKIVISSFYSPASDSNNPVNKLTSVFFYVCHLIDDKLYHNIVKVAVELWAGASGSSANFNNVMTKCIFNMRTDT